MNRFDCGTRRRGITAIGPLCFSVVLLSGCAPSGDGSSGGPGTADRGAQVFSENCTPCHGPGGRGPALAEIKALSSAERREKIRSHPIAGQIPQRLPANQLADVIEFFEPD